MRLIVRLFLLIFSVLWITGCSYVSKPSFIQYRDKHYLTAQSTRPLAIPPGLSSNAFENYYPIPDRNYPVTTKEVSVEPPGLNN